MLVYLKKSMASKPFRPEIRTSGIFIFAVTSKLYFPDIFRRLGMFMFSNHCPWRNCVPLQYVY